MKDTSASSTEGILRVAIHAQVSSDGSAGGVQQALGSLVKALGRPPDAGIEFVLLVAPRGHEWLTNGLGSRFRVEENPRTLLPRVRPGLSARHRLRTHVAQAAALARRLSGVAGGTRPVTSAAAWASRTGADLVHFPYQEVFHTPLPTIFNPWDLQHLNLPQNFSPAVRLERQRRYREACMAARRIVAATDWTRGDLHHHLGVPLEKIVVIPVPPFNEGLPAPAPEELEAVRRRLGVEPPFLLYPAQAFPHKNHLRLLEAVAELRRRGHDIRCVLTGAENPFTATIAQRVRELGLGEHVRFVGFVDDGALRALYRLSRLVVFPSSHEGLGLPLLEAFAEGVPVASSNATCLPEVGQDAALFFSPEDVREMVDVIAGLWPSEERRQDLVEKGRRRLEFFAGDRAALAHFGLYREVGNRAVRDAERAVLASFGNPAPGDVP